MRRLQQLLQSRIIIPEDVLYFTFKKHKFSGRVAQGGLIWHCTWQKPGEEVRVLFQKNTQLNGQPSVRTFESLTDWTETCIQECLDEYHTRYSSWKRVRHLRSEQTMETLFKHLQRQQLLQEHARGHSNKDGNKNILLFEQIASQKQHVTLLETKVKAWVTWFHTQWPDKPLPVEAVPVPAPPLSTAQPFVLTSEHGQFMVLQRINQVAPPECVSWLKQMGQDKFKQHMSDCQSHLKFTPVTDPNSPNTGPNTGPTTTLSPEKVRQFVHEFFK